MKIQSYGRYGDSAGASGKRAVEKLVRSRVDELCDEMHTRPDLEHRQISVSNADGWGITAHLEGRIELYRIEGEVPGRKLYDLPPEELVQLLLDLSACDMPKVLAQKWSAATDRYFYMYASRPDTPDLFRAIGMGDEKWVSAEIALGSDVNHRDEHFATPLHYAALCGWPDVCRLLLNAGADPTTEDKRGETPADHARGADECLHDKKAVAELVALLKEAARAATT
jgi:Ankyrin repeats (many copies)